MKKVLSLLIAGMLLLSCSISAFAATSSIDESEKTVSSIEITKLPTKTAYQLFVDAGWYMSSLENVDEDIDFDQLIELMEQMPFVIDVDLTGAEIVATYNDGSKENVDIDECITSVADPVSISDLLNEDDENAVIAMIIRDYTINVEYKGATASYKVSVGEPDFDFGDEYEVVSYKLPDKLDYVMGKDTLVVYDGDDEEGNAELAVTIVTIGVDFTGMEVVLKSKETGELVTVTADDIDCDPVYVDTDNPAGKYDVTAYANVYDEDDEYLGSGECTFSVNLTEAKAPSTNPTSATEKKNNSTSDTAVNDNTAVQTGNVATAGLVVVIMISAAAFVYFCAKRKISK